MTPEDWVTVLLLFVIIETFFLTLVWCLLKAAGKEIGSVEDRVYKLRAERDEWQQKYYKLVAAIHDATKGRPHTGRTSYLGSESPSQ